MGLTSAVCRSTGGATCSSKKSTALEWSTPRDGSPTTGLRPGGVVKQRGYEGLVAKDEESCYRGGPTRSWVKVKIRREGRFMVGGILGLPHTFAGILVGQRVGRRLLYRGTWNGVSAGALPRTWCVADASAARHHSMTSGCLAA